MRKVFRSAGWNVLAISWGLLVLGLPLLALELVWPRVPGDPAVYGGHGSYWYAYPYNLFIPIFLTSLGVLAVLLTAFSRVVVDNRGIAKYNVFNKRVAFLPWSDIHGCTYHDTTGQAITLLESSDSQIRFSLDTPRLEEITRCIIPHLPELLRPERLLHPTSTPQNDASGVTS